MAARVDGASDPRGSSAQESARVTSAYRRRDQPAQPSSPAYHRRGHPRESTAREIRADSPRGQPRELMARKIGADHPRGWPRGSTARAIRTDHLRGNPRESEALTVGVTNPDNRFSVVISRVWVFPLAVVISQWGVKPNGWRLADNDGPSRYQPGRSSVRPRFRALPRSLPTS